MIIRILGGYFAFKISDIIAKDFYILNATMKPILVIFFVILLKD